MSILAKYRLLPALITLLSLFHTAWSFSPVLSGPKKYELSLCAIFKNEAKFLKEWIEYHLLVGVDHFYLYNNNSSDQFKRVLAPYISNNIVTLIQWPDCLPKLEESQTYMWALSTQTTAYENALKVYGQETKWLVFVDLDEFLIPCVEDSIKQLLKTYEDYPGIEIMTDHFNAAWTYQHPHRKLLIETTELTGFQPTISSLQRGVSKMIVKPECVQGFTWPPYRCCLQGDSAYIGIHRDELRVNHYTNRQSFVLPYYSGTSLQNNSNPPASGTFYIEDSERYVYRFIPPLLFQLGLDGHRLYSYH